MVRGLFPSMSDLSAEPFWYDCRIGSYMIRYKGYFHLGMELPGEVLGKLILGLRAILIWLWDVVLHDQMWVHEHSDVIKGCVPTWSYIRDVSILGMELPSELPGKLSLGLRVILIWLCNVFSHGQIWVHGHSDVIEGCVPTWLDIRVISILSWWEDWFLPCQMWVLAILTSRSNVRATTILWENGGTWSVTRNPQSGTECPFDMVRGLSSFHGHM